MWISVRAFASYREAIGVPSIRLDVPERCTPVQVWERLLAAYPRLLGLPRPHAFAINEEYVQEGHALRELDELILLPPVSGGASKSSQSSQSSQSTRSTETYVDLVERAIDVNTLLRRVQHPQAGAGGLFLGTVRDTDRGQHVKFLDYEAYKPMAIKEMNRAAEEGGRRWALLDIVIAPRLGPLEVGDSSCALAVSVEPRNDCWLNRQTSMAA